jgi:CRISPR/Cas system type I-B associated protein Csh2 (Cas7 group RAMP superfamily)
LGYIVSWAGKDAWDAEGFGRSTMFQVSTKRGVENIVPKVARIVQKYGLPFVEGDEAFYDQLERVNERASMNFQRDQVVGQIRKEAEASWMAKDYRRVAELFQPIRDELTEIDRKKLEYAQKHFGSPIPAKGN